VDGAGVHVTAYASRTGPRPDSKKSRGEHDNGFRYGPGRFRASPSLPEANKAIRVEGVSIADLGFEVLDAAGGFVAWFECIVDALVVRRAKGYAKVVRCSDRALITQWSPPRRGDS